MRMQVVPPLVRMVASFTGRPRCGPDPARGRQALPALRRELTIVRRRGYALNTEQSEQGVNAIGTYVRDRDARAVAAVVLAAPGTRLTTRRLVELAPKLAQTARSIGDSLGNTNSP
ncbi:MAG: IclR family transcriptional regulator domain-containing protein [Jatrophihabitantaceae bacterium]